MFERASTAGIRFQVGTILMCAALCAAESRPAQASPIPPDELYETMPMNLRDGGKVDTAKQTTMPWCASKYTAGSWPVTKFKAKMREYHDFTAWADAAEHLCEHREDPSWVKQATYLVQTWMNAKEINQADAEKEIRAAIAQVAQERSPAGQANASRTSIPRRSTRRCPPRPIAEARKDRPRLMFDLSGFLLSGGAIGTDTNFDAKDFDLTGHAPHEWEKSDSKGVIASTKKLDDGIQVVFKTVKLKWPNYDCVDDTHHPLRINSDGRIEYFQHCKATGTVTIQDATPAPIVIHPLLDAGVKPGAFVQFIEAGPKAKNGNSFGAIVYVKKSSDDKKISTFFGFGL